jgi:hypothetical protein
MNKQQRDLLAQAMVSQTQMAQMCADFPDSKRQFDEMAEALRAAVALFDKLPMTAWTGKWWITPGHAQSIGGPLHGRLARITRVLAAQTGKVATHTSQAHGRGKNGTGPCTHLLHEYSKRTRRDRPSPRHRAPSIWMHLQGKCI